MRKQTKRNVAFLSCLAYLIVSLTNLTGTWPAGSTVRAAGEQTKKITKVVNAMDDPSQWRVENSANCAFDIAGTVSGGDGGGALSVTGSYLVKGSGKLANLMWDLAEPLDLSGMEELLIDVYIVKGLSGKSINLNIDTVNAGVIYMGSPLAAVAEEGRWQTVSIDLTGKQIDQIKQLKFWLYDGDAPDNCPADMTYLIDNIRAVGPDTTVPEPEVPANTTIVNAMDDPSQWRVENFANCAFDIAGTVSGGDGGGALSVTGSYLVKGSGKFANLMWDPAEPLDLSGKEELLIDVYIVKGLSGKSINLNIDTVNAGVIYMGSPFAAVAEEGSWQTVSIDLTGKQIDQIKQLKFWLYDGDAPDNCPADMTYLIDNIRAVGPDTTVPESTPTPDVLEETLINGLEDASQWRIENTDSVAIDAQTISGDGTQGDACMEVTAEYISQSSDFANLVWNPSDKLDLTGGKQLLLDVYLVEELQGGGLNLNISNNGQIIYMDSPFRTVSAGQWTTISIDLTGKELDYVNEFKFWIYGNDAQSAGRMVYRLDNLRILKAKAAPAVKADPASGTVLMPGDTVTLFTDEAAEIYYTTDGTDPKTSPVAVRYTDPIVVKSKQEIRAYSKAENREDSIVNKFRYTTGTGQSGESYLGYANFGAGNYLPVRPTDGITVDGQLDEWQEASGISLALDRYFPADPSDFSMTARTYYDDNALYLGIEVKDQSHSAAYGYGMYGGDCIQVAFSEYGDAYGPEYGFSYYNDQPEIWRWYGGSAKWDKDTISYAATRQEDKTIYEIAIPWQAIFQEKPRSGFRMTILSGDKDADGSSANLEWKPGISSGKVATQFAFLELVEEGDNWKGALVPSSIGSNSQLEFYISNFSDADRTFTYELEGQQTILIPAGSTFKKLVSTQEMADGTRGLRIVVSDDQGLDHIIEWQENDAAGSLDEEQLAARNENLANRLDQTQTLETDALCFQMDTVTGSYLLMDKSTGVLWSSDVVENGIGSADILQEDGNVVRVVLGMPETVEKQGDALITTWKPSLPQQNLNLTLLVTYRLTGDGKGLDVSYQAQGEDADRIKTITLLDQALWTTDCEEGYVVAPEGVGKQYFADGLQQFTKRFETYGDYNMAFTGVVKDGSALLVDWTDPYTALIITHERVDHDLVPGSDMVSLSLELSESSNSFSIHVLGTGSYVEIAKAYRESAQEKGYLVTFAEKKAENADVELLYGAATAKPDTLIRGTDNSYNSHSFSQVGMIAQHWKDVLKLDRAMITLGGWINRGFDNQYPDILPAAPEAGGNDGLAALSRQIQGYDYLFGLHDNYQDMYADAPSFDEQYLMYGSDGRPLSGGVWAGGIPYLMAADKAMTFAYRNLPQVESLFSPNSYFIDTTFNVPLNISYAPNAMTRNDDMYWKQQLAEYAQDTFGIFGSEGGVEWGVPVGDYFEGVLSSKTKASAGDHVIPLMELVYGDCVNLYPHMSDKLGNYGSNTAKGVLADILYAENPLYQLIDGVYYEDDHEMPVSPSVARLEQTKTGEFQITYQWEVLGEVTADCKTVFTHYTSLAAPFVEASIGFQEGHDLAVSTGQWQQGDMIEDGPYTVIVPSGRSGKYAISVMLLSQNGVRQQLSGNGDSYRRYIIGYLNVAEDGTVTLEEAAQQITTDYDVFSRKDGGYGEVNQLGYYDSLIKNTYEVLTYLNRITAETPMTDHAYLTADETVEMTQFGTVRIVANFGSQPYTYEEGTVLPEYGFIIESPQYRAFYAQEYKGKVYEGGALFTVRSLDGKNIDQSQQIQVYHGFGSDQLVWGSTTYEVEAQAVLNRVVTEPTGPTEPTDPTEPSEPAEPSDPAEPGESTEPSDPASPSDPSDSNASTEPTTGSTGTTGSSTQGANQQSTAAEETMEETVDANEEQLDLISPKTGEAFDPSREDEHAGSILISILFGTMVVAACVILCVTVNVHRREEDLLDDELDQS